MENIAAAAILDVLSSGRDPSTGEVLSPDSVLLQDVVVEALQAGARALRNVQTTNLQPIKSVQTTSSPPTKPIRTTNPPPPKTVATDRPLHDRRYQGTNQMEIVEDIKSSHPDHIVFIHSGYMWLVYGRDAVVCSEIFGWKITSANSRFGEHTGVPINSIRFKQRLKDDGLSYVLVANGDPGERLVVEVFTAIDPPFSTKSNGLKQSSVKMDDYADVPF
jgi:hypothetical protein